MASSIPAFLERVREDDRGSRARVRAIALALILLAGVGAFLWMWWITDNGPGVSPDSVTYIEVARSLLAEEGFSARGRPMTHYPPAYPMLLSVAGLLRHGDIVEAARILAALLFGVNVALLGLAVAMCTRYSLSATLCMLLFALLSGPTVSAHCMAWSEAPFIAFSMGAFILLSLHIARSSRYLHVLAAVLASIAIATRYVGVSLLPPMAFGLLVLSDRPVKRRIRDTLVSLIVAWLPLSAWLIRGVVVAQSATNRTFAVHLVNLSHAKGLAGTVQRFILPVAICEWGQTLSFAVVSAVFLLGLGILLRKNVRRHASPVVIAFLLLCIVFCVTYVACLTVSISFFDAHTPVNSRILLPVLLPLTAAGISLAIETARALDRKFIWLGLFFLAGLSVTFNGVVALPTALDIHRHGRGYTSRYWQDSETLSHLRRAKSGRKIYSNGPYVVRFLTEREAVMIPRKTHPGTRRRNQHYEEEIREVLRECREGEALIVYLDGITRWYLPSIEELESKGSLPVMRRLQDGAVYGRN